VRVHQQTDVRVIESAIEGHGTSDRDTVLRAGPALRPQAANILEQAPPPVDWDSTGLNIALYPDLARLISALLTEAIAMEKLLDGPDSNPVAQDLMSLLSRVTTRNPDALSACILILISRAPRCLPTLALLPPGPLVGAGLSIRTATERAAGELIRELEHPEIIDQQIASADLTEAASAARRIATLLRQLFGEDPPTAWRERIKLLRHQLDQSCQARFSEGLTANFLTPLSAVCNTADDGAIDRLENSARGLRILETAARMAGGADIYDQKLRQAADAVRLLPQTATLEWADRIRLVEILAGPEIALTMICQEH
jgi:hypothetical protein